MYIRTIFISIVTMALLSLNACAQSKTDKKQGVTPMTLPKAYGTKPNYRLKIEGVGDKIEIFFNGVEIFHDFGRNTYYEVHPINDFVTTGENELRVRIFAKAKQNFHLAPKGNFDVAFEISDADGEWRTLSHLHYDASSKIPFDKSTPKGYYTLKEKGFSKVTLPAEAEVDGVNTQKRTLRGGKKVNSTEFTQKLTFLTPFPRWKFFDSKNIVDDDVETYTNDEYEKFRHSKKMQKLYDAYEKLNDAIKKRDFDTFIKMYDERDTESALAWGTPKEELVKNSIVTLKKYLDSGEYELLPFDRDKKYFSIDEGKKIAYIPNAVQLKKKGVDYYTSFNMKFRWDGKEWILTR